MLLKSKSRLYWSSRHLGRAAVSWLLSQLRSSAAAAVLSTVYFDLVCVFPAARVLVSFLRELPAAAHSPSALGVAASFVRLDGGLFTLIQGQPVNQGSNFFQLFLQRFVHNVQWSRWCRPGGKNHQNQSVQKWGTRKNLKCGFYDMDC